MSRGSGRPESAGSSEPSMSHRPAVGIEASRWEQLGDSVGAQTQLPLVSVGSLRGFDQSVMVMAQQREIAQRCRCAAPPGLDVMGFAAVRPDVAAGEHAPAVTQDQCRPDSARYQATGSTDIENFRRGAEHGGHDVGIAADLPQLAGRQGSAVGDDAGSSGSFDQLLIVESHQHARQADASHRLRAASRGDQRDERIGATLFWRAVRQRIASFQSIATVRLLVRVHECDEGFAIELGERPVEPNGRALAEEPERALALGCLGCTLQTLLCAFASVDGCYLGQNPACCPRQLV